MSLTAVLGGGKIVNDSVRNKNNKYHTAEAVQREQ